MQVTASPTLGAAASRFAEADHDAADQQGASGNDSASSNDSGASARNPSWLSNFGQPSGIAAQIRAQTCAGTQQNPPSTQTQTAQASPADKSSPAPSTQHADASGATATSANTAPRDTIQAVDEMGQPLTGPSHYNAWTQFGKIWSDNDSLGSKLSQTWKWLNYSTPDAAQRRQENIDRMNAENARWATIDAVRGSGFAGIAVTVGTLAGASDETIARLAQTGVMLEGIAGSVTGAYQQTLTAKAPQPNRVAARPQELEGVGAEAAKATGETAAGGAAGTAAKEGVQNLVSPVTLFNPVFDSATSAAANRLGFTTDEVVINNSVANISIIFTSEVRPSDITAVSNSLLSQGVQTIEINTGPIINSSIVDRLESATQSGRKFIGFDVVKTNNPKNMYILKKELE